MCVHNVVNICLNYTNNWEWCLWRFKWQPFLILNVQIGGVYTLLLKELKGRHMHILGVTAPWCSDSSVHLYLRQQTSKFWSCKRYMVLNSPGCYMNEYHRRLYLYSWNFVIWTWYTSWPEYYILLVHLKLSPSRFGSDVAKQLVYLEIIIIKSSFFLILFSSPWIGASTRVHLTWLCSADTCVGLFSYWNVEHWDGI